MDEPVSASQRRCRREGIVKFGQRNKWHRAVLSPEVLSRLGELWVQHGVTFCIFLYALGLPTSPDQK